ncbi:MAG: transporter substrate-binding domain-containing protein [Enterococcus cecorum]|nr:transporter substrate-binding domain-containing protein [Enterococcus cecorum]
MNKKLYGIFGLLFISSGLLAACGNAKANTEEGKVTTIQVAHTQDYKPYDFVDEKGNSDGFEVAVLKEVDKLLPDYKFKYHPTSDDDLLIGIESGKYDLGTKGAWATEERKKKFIIPNEAVAASVIGITVRTSDAKKYQSLEDFAKAKGKLVPIAPQNAQYNVIQEFNQEHPNSKIELTASESFKLADAYAWVVEKRYDAFFDIKLSFENSVTATEGAYHNLADQLTYVPYQAIPTYPLFNKKDEKLAKAYDQAIKKLKANGTIDKLSQKYFGEDVFALVKK